jgi:hypothetical protein
MFAEDKRLAPLTREEFEMKKVDFVFPEEFTVTQSAVIG